MDYSKVNAMAQQTNPEVLDSKVRSLSAQVENKRGTARGLRKGLRLVRLALKRALEPSRKGSDCPGDTDLYRHMSHMAVLQTFPSPQGSLAICLFRPDPSYQTQFYISATGSYRSHHGMKFDNLLRAANFCSEEVQKNQPASNPPAAPSEPSTVSRSSNMAAEASVKTDARSSEAAQNCTYTHLPHQHVVDRIYADGYLAFEIRVYRPFSSLETKFQAYALDTGLYGVHPDRAVFDDSSSAKEACQKVADSHAGEFQDEWDDDEDDDER